MPTLWSFGWQVPDELTEGLALSQACGQEPSALAQEALSPAPMCSTVCGMKEELMENTWGDVQIFLPLSSVSFD